ncbi:STAS domain-containing protein [Cellulomonas sp. JZ18]|uniref:STAS domain-containing protein n=1 Tax=Cellulomonas sp. JZ18 TaxID=2654191 RepID=UPI0018AF8444
MVALPSTGAIRTTQTPDRTIVRLSGEIDAALRDRASAALSLVLLRHVPVELDTSQVTFIDSAGLSFLVQCCAVARAEGLDVSMPQPARPVADLISLIGVAPLFTPEEIRRDGDRPSAATPRAGRPVRADCRPASRCAPRRDPGTSGARERCRSGRSARPPSPGLHVLQRGEGGAGRSRTTGSWHGRAAGAGSRLVTGCAGVLARSVHA